MKIQILNAVRDVLARRAAEDQEGAQASYAPLSFHYRKTISQRGHTNRPDPRTFTGSGKAMRFCKAFRGLQITWPGQTATVAVSTQEEKA